MFCKNCGNKIKEKSKLCQNCGTPVIIYEPEVIEEKLNTANVVNETRILCRNCGAEINAENEFCPNCKVSVKSSLMSSLAYTLTKVIEKSGKELSTADIAESKEEQLSMSEIIKDFFEKLLCIPICWLTSMLINVVVIPCFSDNWIFIKFLPYCFFCFLIADTVFLYSVVNYKYNLLFYKIR